MGGTNVLVEEFKGCFDKVIGVEYYDCHLAIRVFANPWRTWVDDTLTGQNVLRDLTVFVQSPNSLSIVAKIEIDDAFIRDFTVSDLNAIDGKSFVTYRFVLVPRQVVKSAANAMSSLQNTPTTLAANYEIQIGSVNSNFVATIRGLRVSFGKQLDPNGNLQRLQFLPVGVPVFDNVEIGFAQNSVTAADIDTWIGQVSNGNAAPRNAVIELKNSTLTSTVRTINITGLVPLYSPPFATSGLIRTMLCQVSAFEVQ